MKLSQRNSRHGQGGRMASAEAELCAVSEALQRAYTVFNRTDDPALLEASILEIGALRAKYGSALRNIKALNGELHHDTSHRCVSGNSGSHRHRADRCAAEAAEKTYQMGI